MAGVTSAGFDRPTESELFDDVTDELRTRLGLPSLDVAPDTVAGQYTGVSASKYAELWEAIEATYNSFSDGASGASLDRVCAITGTTRHGPSYSTVTAVVMVAPGTYLAGTITASVDGDPDARFTSNTNVVNGGASPAAFNVTMRAVSTGEVRAPSTTLINLESAPVGVTAITNPADADVGSGTETDNALRVRRRLELSDAGQTTLGALRSALSKLVGIADLRVYTNRTSSVDAAGRPGKSVEALVLGADADQIAQTILDNLPAGIESYGDGSGTGTAVDDELNSFTIAFSRPSAHRVYVRVTGTASAGVYPGDAAVKQIIADFSDGTVTLDLSNGGSIDGQTAVGGIVYRSKYAAAVLSVPGITGISLVELSNNGVTWLAADTQLGAREYLGYSGSRGVQIGDVTTAITVT